MRIFDKLFGKKPEKTTLQVGDNIISFGSDLVYKVIRQLSATQKEELQTATIPVMVAPLFMHYLADDLVRNGAGDQNWLNQVVFFWKAEEPFPKKSLPAIFETYKTKHFVFIGTNDDFTISVGRAAPWFGMPGLGDKHFCTINNEKMPIPELQKLGIVQYVEQTELTAENLDILQQKEAYFFIVDERMLTFEHNNFYLEGNIIPIDVAYSIGGIHLVKQI
jgi:hypothetical protein